MYRYRNLNNSYTNSKSEILNKFKLPKYKIQNNSLIFPPYLRPGGRRIKKKVLFSLCIYQY